MVEQEAGLPGNKGTKSEEEESKLSVGTVSGVKGDEEYRKEGEESKEETEYGTAEIDSGYILLGSDLNVIEEI